MTATYRLHAAAFAATGFLLLAACGGGGSESDATRDDPSAEDPLEDPAGGALGVDGDDVSDSDDGTDSELCGLLADGEIEAAIGPHDGGTISLESGAIYGSNSCLWKATTPEQVEGYPDGYFNSIEVSVVEGDIARFVRSDSESGEPVDGLVDGALFDVSWGQLWFDCGDDRLCHVAISTADELTASGDTREEAAVEFGRLVLERL